MHDHAAAAGYEPKVANTAAESRKFPHPKRKTDGDDSLRLAEREAIAQLPTVCLPDTATRSDGYPSRSASSWSAGGSPARTASGSVRGRRRGRLRSWPASSSRRARWRGAVEKFLPAVSAQLGVRSIAIVAA